MHTDARTLADDSLIEGDLCIIGAGAAGITLAMEWLGAPQRVILLEGGGFTFDAAAQELNQGASTGEPYVPLQAVRLRYFGGTTGHWAGWSAPMDPVDFERREWVPHSGWPITRADLDPFYERAHPYLEIGAYEYDAAFYHAQDPARAPLPLDPRRFWTKMWKFSPPTRFGTVYRPPIEASRNVHLYTHANATEIVANEAVRAVDHIRVATGDGKTHRVRARHYVIACGTIQNARLLLASNRQAPAGLGNDHDLVGRFFMEHFEMAGAQLILDEAIPLPLYMLDFAGKTPRGELAISPEAQREFRVLNSTCSVGPGVFGEVITSLFTNFRERERQREFREGGGDGNAAGNMNRIPPELEGRTFQLLTRAEQSPNPDSRIYLSDERDALGMPRANLEWRFTELDQRSIRIFYELLGEEVGRQGLGRLQLLEWLRDGDDSVWPSFLSGGWHHMGTTRMSADPTQGVVDANATVHGIPNLHVAGASTFTTAGSPNPTLTIVAQSIRLADHLKTRMG